MAKHWIQNAIKHPGALRHAAHIKAGKTLTTDKLKQLLKSKSPLTRKRAALANTLKSFN
jgi:hypothetical protein